MKVNLIARVFLGGAAIAPIIGCPLGMAISSSSDTVPIEVQSATTLLPMPTVTATFAPTVAPQPTSTPLPINTPMPTVAPTMELYGEAWRAKWCPTDAPAPVNGVYNEDWADMYCPNN